jgi:hypothetical protein
VVLCVGEYIDKLNLYFSGNQPRGGRGTPTNNSAVTPVAIVTAKEEHSSQPVVANLTALPAPATNAVLPDSQPITTAPELPVSWSCKFNAILVLPMCHVKGEHSRTVFSRYSKPGMPLPHPQQHLWAVSQNICILDF